MIVSTRPLKRWLATSAGWRLTRPIRTSNCLVLTYHRIAALDDPFPGLPAAVFREQMQWVMEHCRVIAPADLLGESAFERSDRVPVLVTFDDGYRDYVTVAYPVLRELGIPAINFLSTAFIDSGEAFWWDALFTAVGATTLPGASPAWAGGRRFVFDAAGRAEFLRACKLRLKEVPEDLKTRELAELQDLLGVDRQVAVPRQTLTWSEARSTMDITTYGGHTHTHVIVSRVDAARLQQEVETCTARIAAELGARPVTFAYPNGDITVAARDALSRAGYRLAFTMQEGFNTADTDPLALNRVAAPRSVAELAWLAGGFARFADARS
jgi:peptidoglycan/xylan/chitin deacetylase (PgdA/CDA1 family)